MKISPICLVATLGSLLGSPAVAEPARPLVVVDDSELQKQIPTKLEKTEGPAFSGNHVPLSADELEEMESMLTEFKRENSMRLEAGETGWFSFVAKTAWTCFRHKCWRDENGMLTGEKEKTVEVEITSDQALKLEKFMDSVSQATISEDRDVRLASSGSDDETMVAAATTTMRPLFPDDSTTMVSDSDMIEYVNEGSSKAKKQAISTFNVPMSRDEMTEMMAMLETFEKENNLLKESEEFFKLATFVFKSAVTCVASRCWRSEEDEVELGGTRKKKKIQVELTTEQAVVLETFMDEIGDKFIEEGRAQQQAPGQQNLRGGEEFWGAIAGAAISGLFSLFRE